MKDIILVTGFHRTRCWSHLTFNEAQSDAQFSLGFEAPGIGGANINWQVSSLRIQGALFCQGPSSEVRGTQIARANE